MPFRVCMTYPPSRSRVENATGFLWLKFDTSINGTSIMDDHCTCSSDAETCVACLFFCCFCFKKKTFCGTSVQMQNEYIKDSSRICPQTRPCQTNKASSNASPGCLQLTDGAIPACVCLPTFQYHHHHLFLLSTAGHLLLLLCGAACRRIVSLEQLVHLPLHL